MKKATTFLATLVTALLPAITQATTYAEDGAVLLGGVAENSAGSNGNVAAALVGADLSLTCLGLVALIMVIIYILHELWHPKRMHAKITHEELRAGSLRFYVGGTLVWLLVAIMAEKWCIILPLVVIMIACLLYYVYILNTSSTNTDL